MSARHLFIAALVPLAIFTHVACTGGDGGELPGFSLGFGEEKSAGSFGGGNTSAPAPGFGIAPAGSGSAEGDGGTGETGNPDSGKVDSAPPMDTATEEAALAEDTGPA